MASGQTQYYGLNQWETTDQVLRTEFNADNAKIDAAIRALQDDTISGSLLLTKFTMIDEKIAALEQRLSALEK